MKFKINKKNFFEGNTCIKYTFYFLNNFITFS